MFIIYEKKSLKTLRMFKLKNQIIRITKVRVLEKELRCFSPTDR